MAAAERSWPAGRGWGWKPLFLALAAAGLALLLWLLVVALSFELPGGPARELARTSGELSAPGGGRPGEWLGALAGAQWFFFALSPALAALLAGLGLGLGGCGRRGSVLLGAGLFALLVLAAGTPVLASTWVGALAALALLPGGQALARRLRRGGRER